jgi:hypothetical protein
VPALLRRYRGSVRQEGLGWGRRGQGVGCGHLPGGPRSWAAESRAQSAERDLAGSLDFLTPNWGTELIGYRV